MPALLHLWFPLPVKALSQILFLLLFQCLSLWWPWNSDVKSGRWLRMEIYIICRSWNGSSRILYDLIIPLSSTGRCILSLHQRSRRLFPPNGSRLVPSLHSFSWISARWQNLYMAWALAHHPGIEPGSNLRLLQVEPRRFRLLELSPLGLGLAIEALTQPSTSSNWPTFAACTWS